MPNMKKLFVLSLCAATALPVIPAIGVNTSNWTHSSETDFKGGKFDDVVATNLGDLKLSRNVRMLLQQNPKVSSVNSMVQAADGTIYAGTGPHGLLLKIAGDAVSEVGTIDGSTHIFALANDKDGGLLIGTGGESGRVLKISKPAEKPVELFKADGVQYVWALQPTDDGKIYAATGPNGQLFEITPGSNPRVVLDADENNLLSMVSDGKDLLYVGTDPNGLVYRVNRKTNESFVVYDAPEAEISALVIDKNGNVYAGTAEARDEPQAPRPPTPSTATGRPESQPAGVPIPAQPPTDPEPPKVPDPTPGQPDPIPKAPAEKPNEPTAKPAETPATAPKAGNEGEKEKTPAPNEPKPAPPATATQAPAPAQAAPVPTDPKAAAPAAKAVEPATAVTPPAPTPKLPGPGAPMPSPRPTGGGMVPGRPAVDASGAGQPRPEGNAIYRIDTDGFVTEVFRQRAIVFAMAEKEGILFVATGSEGLVYQVDPAAEETIVLAKVDPKQVTTLLPAKDGNIYMGTANVGAIASIGSGYAHAGTYTSGVLDATQISRFGKMQLHGFLPVGTTLTVSTRSGNVKDATQSSWSKWSEPVSAVEYVQISTPAARFLQYRLAFTSGADGKSTPVVEDVGIAYQLPNLPPMIKAIRVTAQPEAATPPAQPGSDAEPVRVPRVPRQQVAWEAADPNGDSVRYALHFRRGTAGPWIPLREDLITPTFDWDTRSVADGRYELRVTATDARSNPPGKARTASRVSDPVQVDNTAPLIGSVKWAAAAQNVEITLRVVDRSSIVSGLDYSVNSAKGWQAVLPSDSIFDSPEEAITVAIPGLPPGNHQVTLRATDAKGNQAFENVFVTVESPTASK